MQRVSRYNNILHNNRLIMKTKIFLIALFASCQIFAQNDKSFLNYVNFNPDSINFEKSDNVGKFINIDVQQ